MPNPSNEVINSLIKSIKSSRFHSVSECLLCVIDRIVLI